MKHQSLIKNLAVEYAFWLLALMGVRIISNLISASIAHRELDFISNLAHGYKGCLVNAVIITALSRLLQLFLTKIQVAN